MLGQEYSHSDPVAAFIDKDKAYAKAKQLAEEKNLPSVWERQEWYDYDWYNGGDFIKVEEIELEE